MQVLLPQSLIWRGHRVNYAGKIYRKCSVEGSSIHKFRPLHGLPVLVKGNIGTRDRMQTNGKIFSPTRRQIWIINSHRRLL